MPSQVVHGPYTKQDVHGQYNIKMCRAIKKQGNDQRLRFLPITFAAPTSALAATSDVIPALRNTWVEKYTTALIPANCWNRNIAIPTVTTAHNHQRLILVLMVKIRKITRTSNIDRQIPEFQKSCSIIEWRQQACDTALLCDTINVFCDNNFRPLTSYSWTSILISNWVHENAD